MERGGTYCNDDDLNNKLAFIAKWLTSPSRKGLLMLGTPGNGKTTMLRTICGVINAVNAPSDTWAYLDDNYVDNTIHYFTSNEITNICKTSYDKFQRICKYNLLAIDDLGREPVAVKDYGNTINPVIELIQYRYDKMLPTLCTSNLDINAIRTNYGERIYDRFREMMCWIVYNRKSYRGNFGTI